MKMKMRMEMRRERSLSRVLLSVLALLLILMPGTGLSKAYAAGAKSITGIGTGSIQGPQKAEYSTSPWVGNYVYYGKYSGSPVKYRVLTTNTSDFGGTTMLLDCDSVLLDLRFDNDGDPNEAGHNANEWAYSDVKANLNGDAFLNSGVFSDAEKTAIAASTKTEAANGDGSGKSYLGFAALNGDKIFLLDAKEVTRESYGYETGGGGGTGSGRIKGGAKLWWLRSPYSIYDIGAGCVNVDGYVVNYYVKNDEVGVSPAFNVNLSSVIFSSEISSESGSYKLTLKDGNMEVNVPDGSAVTRDGSTVKVPYSITGANAGKATQVSVLILPAAYSAGTASTNYLYYGKLNISSFQTSGEGTFTLPDTLASKVSGTDYFAYILAENVSAGEKETDYASSPVLISIPAAHSHDWSFSATGAAITAACNGAGTCDVSGSGLTLTLSPPASTGYDGSPKACTLNTDYNQSVFSDGPYTIYYEGQGSTSYGRSSQAPADAGSYQAEVTAKGKTASVTFTITPKPVTATVTAAGRGYEEGNRSVTLSPGQVNDTISGDDVNVDISEASGTMADDNAGENKPVTVSGVKLGGGKAGNYTLSDQPSGVTVNISKALNPAAIETAAAVTVGGNTVSLAGNVSSAKGGVSYAIDKDSTGGGCSVEADTGLFTSGTLTGECKVAVTVAGDGNYESASGTITVTVTDKLTQALAFAEAEVTKTIGDAPFVNALSGAVTAVSYAVTDGADVASVAADGTVTIIKTGTATITATAEETNEYAAATAHFTLRVNEAAAQPTPEEKKPGDTVPDIETKEQKGACFYPLFVRQKKVTNNTITITWKKMKGATSYTVYGCRCGQSKFKKLKTVKKTSYTQKKLKAGQYYKYFVKASCNGKVIATSTKVHICTTGGSHGNPSSVKLSKKSVKLKVGKTWKIKASVKNKGRVSHHRELSYVSTNPEVAKVDKKGKVKAVAAGTCYVYVYEQNGVFKKVKITVK